MEDKPTAIRAENITVATGYKCKYCGVVRSFDRPRCFCEKAKDESK